MIQSFIPANRFGTKEFFFTTLTVLVAVVFTIMLSPQKAFAAGDLTSVTIVSNNAASTTLAHPGNIVTVSFTASSSLSVAPTATINGVAAAISGSGTSWTAATTTNAATANGLMTFVISDTEFSSTYTATTNGSAVTFSNVLPIIAPITIASNNASTSLAKSGNTVTLSFTSSEAIQVPTVTIGAHSGITAVTSNPTASTTWTASATISSSDTSGSALSFTITAPTDLYGNATSSATWLTSGSNVIVDNTAPVITLLGSNVVSLNQNATYTDAGATATDLLGHNITSSIVTSNPVNTAVPATYTVTYNVSDAAGIAATAVTRTVTVNGGGGGGIIVPCNPGYTLSKGFCNPSSTSTTPTQTSAVSAGPNSVINISTGVTAYTFTRALSIGSTGADVTALQNLLSQDGFYNGPVTGYFGSLTKMAVKLYQKANGLSQVGIVGPLTLALLNQGNKPTTSMTTTSSSPYNFAANLDVGSTGADVTALQQWLTQKGFYSGPVSGYFGNLTLAAIKALQGANNLSQTGYVGPLTRAVLNKTK